MANQLLDDATAARADFAVRFPTFDPDGSFGRLRTTEYGRLDEQRSVYLDYGGGSLHAASQIDAHAALLRDRVFGNPHSDSPASLAATEEVEAARRQVLEFFGAPPDDYLCIFTANASGALKLIGEAYPFAPGGTFLLSADNHNSVNGIREFARRAGATIEYLPIEPPELRLDRASTRRALAAIDPTARNLLAFPAQSNYSGVRHPLELVDEAHDRGCDVLIDATAFAPTTRFELGRIGADFAVASFYKIFGYPTGIGCLLVRRDRVASLTRPWFAGGTVIAASVGGDGHHLHDGAAAFEDGTVDYLNLPAITTGLRHIERIGIEAIHHRVDCLTSWLLDELTALRHPGGRSMVHVLGPTTMRARGGTIAFVLIDRHGRRVDDDLVERCANRANIALRRGCFCNPGASEAAHGLEPDDLRRWFGRDEPMVPGELRDRDGRQVSALRLSLGVATNFADVHRAVCLLRDVAAGVDTVAGGSPGGALEDVRREGPGVHAAARPAVELDDEVIDVAERIDDRALHGVGRGLDGVPERDTGWRQLVAIEEAVRT